MINVEMLSTGDEVLHGQIIDTNAAWLADLFFEQGLPLTRRNTVGDNLESLVNILRERSEQADYDYRPPPGGPFLDARRLFSALSALSGPDGG